MDHPKLRRLDRHRLDRDGEALVVLRDPLGVSEPVALPAEVGPLLDLLDGKHSPAQVRHSLLLRGRATFEREAIDDLIDDLSEAGLLDDDAFRRRWAALHSAFVDGTRRGPAFADILYPGEPAALAALLTDLLGPAERRIAADSRLTALVIPHQPFEVAGPTLRATLVGLPPARELDAIVILGADHHPGLTPFAATAKTFDTPLGPVAADQQRVAGLAKRLPWLLQEEIRHRSAATIELAAILLRHLYSDETPPIIPILCGQSALLVGDASAAADDFYATLDAAVSDRRVLWIAVAELGHCGPAYGRPALTATVAERLAERDVAILQALRRGHLHELQRRCLAEDPVLGPPSGAAVLTTLGRLLPVGLRGEITDYRCLPAPGGEEGLLGLGGVRLDMAEEPAS